MKIKTKIFVTLLAMSLLVALVGALAVNRQRASAMVAATKEAENVASVLSFLMSAPDRLPASIQQIVAKLHRTQGRDVVLVDAQQRIQADATPVDIGQVYEWDRNDEVGLTIKDRKVRTFIEISKEYPAGAREIVVPVVADSGQVLGAVVMEYTPLYDELMRLRTVTIREVALTGFAGAGMAILLALYMGRSIGAPLEQLTKAATAYVSGRKNIPMPSSRTDEIGELVSAFNSMMVRQEKAEDDLRRTRDELEVRVTERTRELSDNNERLQMQARVIESMTEGVIVAGGDGKIITTNAACDGMFGYERGELIGQHVSVLRDLDESEGRQLVEETMAAVQEGLSWSGEINRRKKDGMPFLVQAQISVFEIAGKRHFFAVQEDITERKQAEESLRESEEKFHQLADNINDVFWITSPDLKIMHYISAGYESIWGRSMESLLAHPHQWIEAILPEERERVFAIFGGLMENEPQVSVEYRIGRPDGTVRWVHDRGFQIRDTAGKLVRLAGIVTDITERKQAEQEQARFAAIMEATTDFVAVADGKGHVLYVNPAGRRMMGFSEKEDITTTMVADYSAKSDLHRTMHENIPTAMREGVWSGESTFMSRDGHEIPLSQVVVAHKSANGEVEFLATTGRDLTERKRMEAKLLEAGKLETVGRLAGGIAHDFNTILTAIIGHAELIEQGVPAGGAEYRSATQIGKSALRAAELTQQLLAFSRKQMLRPELLDLNATVRTTELLLRRLLGEGIDVRVALAAQHPWAKADPAQIQQMLIQLALNAQDAMPRGGRLTLETGDVILDENYVSTRTDVVAGEYVMIAITDTGTGISDEVRARLFEPFFTTKPQGEGTGMGLSMCYGIAKQIGGHINVYSELGHGTTFKVFLPQVAAPTVQSTPLPRLEATPTRGTETILLVEDDAALRDLAGIVLEKLGYKVHQAANGHEAIEIAEHLVNVDLLLTDVVMPQMSGKELAKHLRPTRPNMKVLFTSAYTEEAIVHHGILDPGIEFLHKPYTPTTLAQKARQALG